MLWPWWTLALVLLLLELVVPGVAFLWFALAAGAVGLMAAALPETDWTYQLLAFAVLALASVGLVFGARIRNAADEDVPADDLNRRAAGLIGQRFTVVQAIEQGRGRVRVGDGTWVARGPDLPAGSRVRVVGTEGTILVVEAEPQRG